VLCGRGAFRDVRDDDGEVADEVVRGEPGGDGRTVGDRPNQLSDDGVTGIERRDRDGVNVSAK